MATTCHGKLDLRQRIQEIINRNRQLGETNLKHEVSKPLSTSTPNKTVNPNRNNHRQIICKVSPRINTSTFSRSANDKVDCSDGDFKKCVIDLPRIVEAVVNGGTGSGYTDRIHDDDVISSVSEIMGNCGDARSEVGEFSDVTDSVSEEWTGDTFILGSPQYPVATLLDQKFSPSVTARIQEVIQQLTRQNNMGCLREINSFESQSSPWSESPIDCVEANNSNAESECTCEGGHPAEPHMAKVSMEELSCKLWPVLSRHLSLNGENNRAVSQQEFLQQLKQHEQECLRREEQQQQDQQEPKQLPQQQQQQQQQQTSDKHIQGQNKLISNSVYATDSSYSNLDENGSGEMENGNTGVSLANQRSKSLRQRTRDLRNLPRVLRRSKTYNASRPLQRKTANGNSRNNANGASQPDPNNVLTAENQVNLETQAIRRENDTKSVNLYKDANARSNVSYPQQVSIRNGHAMVVEIGQVNSCTCTSTADWWKEEHNAAPLAAGWSRGQHGINSPAADWSRGQHGINSPAADWSRGQHGISSPAADWPVEQNGVGRLTSDWSREESHAISTQHNITGSRNTENIENAGNLMPDEKYTAWSMVGGIHAARPEILMRTSSQPSQNEPSPATKTSNNNTKEQQLQAYAAWLNSQLKKKAGTRVIEDLRVDMQDGVALADLIEIVAGEKLEGVYAAPSNADEMRENVDKVLRFMTLRRIRMHHTTAKDIVDGNIKSIMRLVLALAAHFKPGTVRQSSTHGTASPVNQHQSVVGIAQGAAAALADARRDASFTSHRPRRPKYLIQEQREAKESRLRSSGSDTDRSGFRSLRSTRDREELEGASSGSSPQSSTTGSPSTHHRRLELPGGPVSKSKSQEFETGHGVPSRSDSDTEDWAVQSALWKNMLDEHDKLTEEMDTTRHTLLCLQNLLLSGQLPDGTDKIMDTSTECEPTTPHEQIVILNSKLQQIEEVNRDLREELSRVKNECMEKQGTQAGLQQRINDQETTIQKMKAELLRAGFAQQSLETEKNDLEKQVLDKDRIISEMKREITNRDRQIEDLMTNLQLQHQEKESATRTLRAQITDLHEKLKRVGDTEATLSARVASQDRKMARLEGKIFHTHYDSSSSRPSSARSAHSTGSDEIQMVRDSLQNLRTSFPGNDPNHHTIDTLEQNISLLMERLYMSEQNTRISDGANTSRGRLNYDSTGDIRRSPITALHGFSVQRVDHSSASTKVLYFTDRTVTPFMCSIPKRLGDIRLRDFKSLFDRAGQYRYHFKSMDPEFGTVKEEISHDEDIIPGWEGKIVAWIEEDHG